MSERNPPAITDPASAGGGASPDPIQLADRLHSVAIHLLRRVRRQDAHSGLTPARLSALSVVVFGGPLGLGELAAAEQVRAPTMSRTVAALEGAGLLRRRVDPHDGRAVVLEATREGERLLAEARGRRVRALAGDLGRLAPDDLDALRRSLAAITRVLDLPDRQPAGGPR